MSLNKLYVLEYDDCSINDGINHRNIEIIQARTDIEAIQMLSMALSLIDKNINDMQINLCKEIKSQEILTRDSLLIGFKLYEKVKQEESSKQPHGKIIQFNRRK